MAAAREWVDIAFDCLPLRQVGRLDAPLDASPAWREFSARLAKAIHRHGTHRAYYLHRGQCTFHLTNDPSLGRLVFRFEGTVLTDESDRRTVGADLHVDLESATCEWLTEPVVQWFARTVSEAVSLEFNRFIEAGDLEQARRRMEALQAEVDEQGGYLGMYL